MPQLPPDSHWARRSQTLPLAGDEPEPVRVTVERRVPEAGAADRSSATTRVTAAAGSGRCLTCSPLVGSSSRCPGWMRLGWEMDVFRSQIGRQLGSLARLAIALRV